MAKKIKARPPAAGKTKRTGTIRTSSPAKQASRAKPAPPSSKKKAARKTAAQLFPIVAVGASAGGLVAGQPKKRQPAAERDHAAITRELAETKRDLHAIIQEQEATNEELQAANEEILSSNEELQSTNEELQTAKEELQATNEELTTVNEEMQNRNAELTHAMDDLRNLTASIDVGIVMLESDLTIRHFTPAAAKVLNLIAGDIGRPIGNIKPNLNVSDLDELIAQSVDGLVAVEHELQDSDGRWYSMRIRPYKTEDNRIAGAVVAFLDIHQIKQSQEALETAQIYAENIVNTIREPLVVLDENLRVISANASFYQTFQVPPDETEGCRIYDLGNRQWNIPQLRELLEEIIPERHEFQDFEVAHNFPSLGPKTMLLNARQIETAAPGRKLILLAIADVTKSAAKGQSR
jgi:two-component system CheB/CheR fusion protein